MVAKIYTQRLAAGGAASTLPIEAAACRCAFHCPAQCKPLQPVDGSPPQQQRTKSQLDRTEAAEVKRSLFASPAAPADQHRVDELQRRVEELERTNVSMHAREADLLRRLAFYNPNKWTQLAAEARM